MEVFCESCEGEFVAVVLDEESEDVGGCFGFGEGHA